MSEAYERDSIFVAYTKWHYGRGLKELFGVSSNFLWFITNFFSFQLLFKTLFIPWKRMGESYEDSFFNFGALASVFMVNSIMRAFGFVTKIIIMIVGLSAYTFVLCLSLLVLLIWVLAPAVLIGSLILSVTFFAV